MIKAQIYKADSDLSTDDLSAPVRYDLGITGGGQTMIKERDNALLAINHGKPYWTPCFYDAYSPMGSSLLNDHQIS